VFDRALYRLSCCPAAEAEEPHGPGGRARVTVCPKRSPRRHRGADRRGAAPWTGQPRGDSILCVWAPGYCVLTSVSPSAYRSAKNKMEDSQRRRQGHTRERMVCVCVYVNVYIIHPNEFSGCLHTGNVPDANVPLSSQLTLKSPGGDTDGVTLLLHPGRLPYSLFPISSLHIPVIALSLSVCTSLSFSDGLRSICLSTFLPGDTSHLTHIC